MTALHEQYRPRTWDDVAGQPEAVAAIRSVLARGWGGRAWAITGLSGQGKTTLAKLIAAEGADQLAWREIPARTLTPKGVEDLEEWYATRTMPINGKSGRAVFINEYHGLRQDTLEMLLDTLERIPEHVCWLLTTTYKGQQTFFGDDSTGDRFAAASRFQVLKLEKGPEVFLALAKRAKAVAQAAGVDGLPDSVYELAVAACDGNLRAVLQRVESGQLQATARAEVSGRLQALPLDGRHSAERVKLQTLLWEIG